MLDSSRAHQYPASWRKRAFKIAIHIIWPRTGLSAGAGRLAPAVTPVPGAQAQFGALMRAWADAGAHRPG
jgi:hypothetical protein